MADLAPDVNTQKRELLEDIDHFCTRYGPDEKDIVLVVGKTGVGKSAAINTIAKVVNGEYFQIAPVGEGVALSKTRELLTYSNCGARTDIPRRHTDEEEDEIFERVTKHLPHLIDFAGLGNADTPELREILEMLIAGHFPPGLAIQSLQRDQKRYGVGCLRSIYPTPNPEWRVTKIVFVHSCLDTIPTELIGCLTAVINTVEQGSTALKYTGDVFLLITKYDCVDSDAPVSDSSQNEDSDGARRTISMKDFLLIESTLARLFNIRGALEFNRLRWTSYGGDTGYNNENIDLIALQFIKQMVMPTKAGPHPIPPDTPSLIRWKLEMQRSLREMYRQIRDMNFGREVIIPYIIIVVLVVYWFFARGVEK